MNEERWEQLYQIFDTARALPASAAAEFIARSCGTDDALRAQAQSLLDADGASGEFMVKPAFDRLAEALSWDRWSLSAGELIGPYTIIQLLGSGGTGEVWRARDERLGRDVAIKVLSPHFATDADRLRRFAEEARTAGALNHSNILTVYDVGEHHGIPYLVSECLEGQSLRERLDAGAMSVQQALAIGRDIARGLAAAHARSIIHRDLKPENTFLNRDGAVKILDFGLAKLQSSLEGVQTRTHRTMTGVILGTAGYMAPEQINGETVDARADLFTLGVMLYEMLAGQQPFRRASTFESLHAVLTITPPALTSVNPQIPASLGRIVMRLLEKVPQPRFQSALDVLWALEQVDAGSAALTALPAPSSHSAVWWRSRLAIWLSAPIVSALALFAVWWFFLVAPRQATRNELTRFTWPLPSGMALASAPMVSPDGRQIAFVGRSGTSRQLYVRDRGSVEAVAIPNSEGAAHPFWSPNTTFLGFFAREQLMKVAWRGGAPAPLAQALFPFGGTSNSSGTIVFAPDVILTGLFRVGPPGGKVESATLLDPSLGDTSHCWPAFLPDGVHFVYFVRSAQDDRRGLYLGRIDRPAAHADSLLLRADSNAVYVPVPGTPEGVLLYVVSGRIEARRFDTKSLSLVGDTRTIGLAAAGTTLTQPAMLSASADVLVFAASTVPYGNRLEAVDRSGRRLRLWNEPEAQNWPRISPDGRFLARQRVDELRNTPDIWVEDLERGTNVRVTTAIESDIRPVWSADGRYLAYVSGKLPRRPGTRILNIAAADGTGVVRKLPCPGEYCEPTDWTPRGLLVNVLVGRNSDVWMVPTENGTAAQPLLADAFAERDARISPNGRWVAYVSEESGRPEVSVRTVSGSPRRIAISGDGGDHPVWRGDGAELFFVDPHGQLLGVTVQWSRDGSPTFGLSAKLNVPSIGQSHWGTPYDVSPDGSRIYFLRGNDDPPPHEIHVVIGWRELLGW